MSDQSRIVLVRGVVNKLLDKFARFRRRAKVEITCRCGSFIPGTYLLGRPSSRYCCKRCGFEVRISTHRGEATW